MDWSTTKALSDHIATFIVFFSVIDPVGTIPVFIAVTSGYSLETKRRIALIATLVATGVLLFFVVFGELILNAMSIPLPAFQISGGIVLFLFAMNMIFGESKPEEEVRLAEDTHKETAVFPLAVPSIASPGAMLAAVLTTENAKFTIWEQTQTTATMIVVILIAYVLMLFAGWIHQILGKAGASIISRVMGLILSSVAASNVLAGLKTYFAT